jgi:hypothetical protein
MNIEKGSVWSGTDGTTFQVITEVLVEGNEWVHYRRIDNKDPKEFSCFKESFLARFTRIPKN